MTISVPCNCGFSWRQLKHHPLSTSLPIHDHILPHYFFPHIISRSLTTCPWPKLFFLLRLDSELSSFFPFSSQIRNYSVTKFFPFCTNIMKDYTTTNYLIYICSLLLVLLWRKTKCDLEFRCQWWFSKNSLEMTRVYFIFKILKKTCLFGMLWSIHYFIELVIIFQVLQANESFNIFIYNHFLNFLY